MKRNSLSQQWNNLSGFWKFIYFNVFLFMPWTLFLVILGVWHIDSRIDELCDSVESKSDDLIKLYSDTKKAERFYPIDTIERCK